jgi:two-component system NtrC family sensor kinase
MEEELRRLSDAVRMSTDSIVITDLEGNVIDVNEATLKIQGTNNKEDLSNLRMSDFIVPEEQEEALGDLSQVIEEGHVNDIQYHILTRDGRKVLVETNASVMRGRNGEPVGLVAVTRDITERKRMEDALRESEERLRRLVDHAPDIIFRWSIEKGLEYVSPVVSMITGYSAEELMADPTLGLKLAKEKDLGLVSDYNRVSAEGISERTRELSFVRKDGKQAYLDIKTQAIRNDEGKIIAFEGILRDITERKRMEEALKRSEHNYRILFESTIDGMLVFDVETMKVVIANQTALRMLGFDCAEEVIGAHLLDLIYPDDRDKISRIIMENRFGRGLDEIREFRAITGDGRQIWVSAVGTRIEYEGKMADLVSARDITERKRMEEEKQKMEEQLRLASRLAAVGELAAGVAHELNNPIAAIQGFAQFLTARKDLDETIRNDLDTIYRESQRAAKITRNLLSFARRHEPEKHLISLNEVIEKTLELRVHIMKLNNLELVVELAPDLPKTLADFHQMQQVFVNIVNNAEQAMIEAHGKGRLVVKTRKAGNMIQISFADDGPGISEENLKRIFDPFFTTKEVGKGTGLGLSICYGLVEAHGGRIYVRSKLRQGATFVVEIPIVSENELVAEAVLLNPGSRGVKWKKPRE